MFNFRLGLLPFLFFVIFRTLPAQEITQAVVPLTQDSPLQDRNNIMFALQQQQQVDQLIVEYVWDEPHALLYIYTEDKQEGVAVQKVEAGASFKTQLDEMRKMLNSVYLATDDQRERFLRQSYGMCQILIKPIEKQLTNKASLHIICDEPLAYFPFEILVEAPVSERYSDLPYLLKKYVFSYSFLSGGSRGGAAMSSLKLPATSTAIELPVSGKQMENQASGKLMEGQQLHNTLVRLWNMRESTLGQFMTQIENIEKERGCYRAALHDTKIHLLSQPETAVPNYWGGLILVKHL